MSAAYPSRQILIRPTSPLTDGHLFFELFASRAGSNTQHGKNSYDKISVVPFLHRGPNPTCFKLFVASWEQQPVDQRLL